MVSDYGNETACIAFVNLAAKDDWEQMTGLSTERPANTFTKSVHNVQVERFWGEPNNRITKPTIVRAASRAQRALRSLTRSKCRNVVALHAADAPLTRFGLPASPLRSISWRRWLRSCS